MSDALWAILGVAGAAGVATLVDHENLLGNNPGRKFWWERPPFVQPTPGALQNQQQIKELVAAELRRREQAEEAAKSRSKYAVTQPFPQGNFSQKGYPGAYQ
jgi:hypothetical protein